MTWWVVGTLAVVLPFLLLFGTRPPSPQSALESLGFQVRLRNVMWRMTQLGDAATAETRPKRKNRPAVPTTLAQPDTDSGAPETAKKPEDSASNKAPGGDAAGPALRKAPASAGRLRQSDEAMRDAVVELFEHAKTAGDAGRELVIAHAIAVDANETAVRLASRLKEPSEQMRAALAATAPARGQPAASPLAMGVTAADAVVGRQDFGGGWGQFVTHRVQARVHALAGNQHGARRANDALAWSDSHLLPLLYTLLQAVLMAGLFGTGIWLFGSMRASAARRNGLPRLAWLTARHQGLDDSHPYLNDRLVPLLGFGAWLMVYLLAGVLIEAIPGRRGAAGFQVLFQALSGAVFAAWVVSSFSRTPLPLDAAHLRPSASGSSPWRASTAALWAYCAVLPPMLFVALINVLVAEMVGLTDAAPHPVVGMLLKDGDPLQLGALAVAVTFAAPLGEELIFRAFLYRALRRHAGVLGGALISGAVFSLLHMSPAAFLPYMTLGVAFALVFEWTGSLWSSIILHGLWNAIVFGCMAVVTLS
ncbi:MAG: CPBP family intramembrane metalloprotease [Myxococcales bacterium]|nr:CPBP family intramembrane metalloprotease [Myxococcales bacterium]